MNAMTQDLPPALGDPAPTLLHDAAIASLTPEAGFDEPRECSVVSTPTGSVSRYTTRNEARS